MKSLSVYKSEYPKIRLGNKHDGGYVIADLPGSYDHFISGGIANDIEFERSFLERYDNIEGIGFDGTIDNLPYNLTNFKFIKKNLGNINNENTTDLIEYLNEYNSVFLKIDIEGHEFKLFPKLIENGLMIKIKQFVIEIHSPNDIKLHPKYYSNILKNIDNDLMFNMFRNFNKTHTLIHFHANNGCKMSNYENINLPHVFELTYIRNDYVSKKILNNQPFPTKLDSKNVRKIRKDYYFDFPPYCWKS